MTIRKLTDKEASAFHELRLTALLETPEAFLSTYADEKDYSKEKIVARVTPSATKFMLGFFADGQLVGVVGFYQETASKLQHCGTLFGMYVVPEFRRQQLGEKLLTELFLILAQEFPNVEQVYLNVLATNLGALRLYKNFNFEEYGFQKHALKWQNRYYDEVLMVKYL